MPISQHFNLYILFLILLFTLGCQNRVYNNEDLLLEWKDSEKGIIFRVTEKSGALVHTYTKLYVEKGDQVKDIQIDDDAVFGNISFVRYENWLLVLDNDEVWSGYDFSNSRLIGEHMWEELPFTIRKSKGSIVAERKIRLSGGASPAGFPKVPEKEAN